MVGTGVERHAVDPGRDRDEVQVGAAAVVVRDPGGEDGAGLVGQ